MMDGPILAFENRDIPAPAGSVMDVLNRAGFEVRFVVYAEDMDPGDLHMEPEVVEAIRAGVAAGDLWAWFFGRLEVRHHDAPSLVGVDTLGGCSYHGPGDWFCYGETGGYWQDMLCEALYDLEEVARRASSDGKMGWAKCPGGG
jgi:hypothetical protein